MNKTISNLIFCNLLLLFFLNYCNAKQENEMKVFPNDDLINATSTQNSITQNNKIQNGNVYQDNKPVIKPSRIAEDLLEKKRNSPKISAKELADFGNLLLRQKGFNFDIDLADLVEKKTKSKETKTISNEEDFPAMVSFSQVFTLFNGTKKTFQTIAPDDASCCCGYYYTEFPVANITDKQMTLVVDGEHFIVKRTKEISFSQEHILVDNETMKKEIRKWQVPNETYPAGISEDGTKLYVEQENDIFLEISGNGDVRFVPKETAKIIASGKDLRELPTPKIGEILYKSGEFGYMNFKSGDKNFTIKFFYPCT